MGCESSVSVWVAGGATGVAKKTILAAGGVIRGNGMWGQQLCGGGWIGRIGWEPAPGRGDADGELSSGCDGECGGCCA